jgi:hypothetical protein
MPWPRSRRTERRLAGSPCRGSAPRPVARPSRTPRGPSPRLQLGHPAEYVHADLATGGGAAAACCATDPGRRPASDHGSAWLSASGSAPLPVARPPQALRGPSPELQVRHPAAHVHADLANGGGAAAACCATDPGRRPSPALLGPSAWTESPDEPPTGRASQRTSLPPRRFLAFAGSARPRVPRNPRASPPRRPGSRAPWLPGRPGY